MTNELKHEISVLDEYKWKFIEAAIISERIIWGDQGEQHKARRELELFKKSQKLINRFAEGKLTYEGILDEFQRL